jgi:hypothetical protein
MDQIVVVLPAKTRRFRRERCVAVCAVAGLAHLFRFFLAGFVVAGLSGAGQYTDCERDEHGASTSAH